MALTDLWIGRAPIYDPEQDQLSKPVPQEADDLSVHVELCARRYKAIMQGVARAELASYDIKAFITRAVVLTLVGTGALVKGPDIVQMIVRAL